MKHKNRMVHMNTKKITFGALIVAISVLLPQAFHFAGQQAGQIFLPMHIPVLLGGFILGPGYGLAIGILSPVLSSLLTSMPPMAKLPFMILELAAYGFASGLLYGFLKRKKAHTTIAAYISLIAAMAAGRLVYALSLFVAAEMLGIACDGPAAAVASVVTGIYGIAIQIIIIPPIVIMLERTGLLDRFNAPRKTAEK